MADSKKYTSKLEGKRVLVGGGSSGIGYGIAEAAVEYGAYVTITSSSTAKVEQAIASLVKSYPSAKSRVFGFACDLASDNIDANVKKLLEQSTAAMGGKLDHIASSAGDSLVTTPIEDVSLESIEKAGRVRFTAAVIFGKYAPQFMIPGPGSSLTFTSGVNTDQPSKNWYLAAAYGGAITGLIRGLAVELAPMRANVVSPGLVDTPLVGAMGEETKNKIFSFYKGKSTTGEVGTVENVAEAYIYFMRDHNVTGTSIDTSSGALLS